MPPSIIAKPLFISAFLLCAAVSATAQISVTYIQAVKYLESDFKMDGVGAGTDNQKIVGQSKDGVAIIELVGSPDNLTSASLTIAVPNDSEALRARNSARLLRFLSNTIPEWKGNNDWVKMSLKKITRGDFSVSSITVAAKSIKMESIKEGAIILTTVEKVSR